MKLLLVAVGIDVVAAVVFCIVVKKLVPNPGEDGAVTKFLTRYSRKPNRPNALALKLALEVFNKGERLFSEQPRWATAQGLTLLEELEAWRYYNKMLVHYCGTDDLGRLIAMAEFCDYRIIHAREPDDQVKAWQKFVSARPGAEDRQ